MIAALFVLFAVLIVGAVMWLMWPEDNRKQFRILHADAGTPWILQRKKHLYLPFTMATTWETVGEYESQPQAQMAMLEAVLHANPFVVAEFDARGREVA